MIFPTLIKVYDYDKFHYIKKYVYSSNECFVVLMMNKVNKNIKNFHILWNK